jgi:hypothetical protein
MFLRFTYIVTGLRSFLQLSYIPLCGHHILFTRLSVDGHFGCFFLLAPSNRAVSNICVQDSAEHLFSAPLGTYLRVELLGLECSGNSTFHFSRDCA